METTTTPAQKPMTTQEVIDLITPIPEDQFCVDDYYQGRRSDPTCCCVLGHLNRVCTGDPSSWLESVEDTNDYYESSKQYTPAESHQLGLRHRSAVYLKDRYAAPYGDIAGINNQESKFYPQPTPKQRVLALLNDMLAAGY